MLTEALTAPTVDDARRAGRELADAGASRVLLFGSVAQDRAQPDSDIDLVAIFDDLDYTRRLSRQLDLQTAAQACTSHRVQVHVTDWPEWLHRTRRVSASFEAGIAAEAQVLYARPAADVTWDKEIGLPADNIGEALGRLDEAAKALNDLLGHTRLSELEQESLIAADRASADHYRHWRLINVCQSAAMAIETSLKSLIALAGEPVRRMHDIDYLVNRAAPTPAKPEPSSNPSQRAVPTTKAISTATSPSGVVRAPTWPITPRSTSTPPALGPGRRRLGPHQRYRRGMFNNVQDGFGAIVALIGQRQAQKPVAG